MPHRSKISTAHQGLITERDKDYKRTTLKAFNPFFYLAETPGTGLASHSIHLHAVLANWRVKHTANIIYIIMTHLKI